MMWISLLFLWRDNVLSNLELEGDVDIGYLHPSFIVAFSLFFFGPWCLCTSPPPLLRGYISVRYILTR